MGGWLEAGRFRFRLDITKSTRKGFSPVAVARSHRTGLRPAEKKQSKPEGTSTRGIGTLIEHESRGRAIAIEHAHALVAA